MKLTSKILTLMLAMVLVFSTFSISASAAGSIVYGIGFVDATSLRMRSQPSTSSSIVATAQNKECVVVLSKTGQWYQVSYNLQEGYMHEDYLDVATKENAELGYGKIGGSGVNLRSGPSTSHKVVAVSDGSTPCYIIGINEGWYKVLYNGKTCYIRSDFVTLTEIPYENKASNVSPKYYRGGKAIGAAPAASAAPSQSQTVSAPSSAPSVSTVSVTGDQIVTEARKYIGCPYRAGGATPDGFDCSGFVYYVLKQMGLSPSRTPESQYAMGTPVSKSQLQPGDLVFFAGTYTSGISHAGIYTGNGQFIHAPNSRSTISHSSLTSGYWAQTYYGACRVV